MAAWKKNMVCVVITTFWCTIGVGAVVLLIAAMQKKNHELCKGYEIEISGNEEELFLDKEKIEQILFLGENPVNKPMNQFDLKNLEKKIKSNVWVREADLFFDNADMLQVKVKEREPIARVFTQAGNSYYLDSSATLLPTMEVKPVQLMVFTDFPEGVSKQKKTDSTLLHQMVRMAQFMNQDSFWTAQVEQVAITPNKTFELVPLIGKHIVEFGSVDQLEEKFKRLHIFYTQILAKVGLDHYEKIDVQYGDQVVATKKAAPVSKQDSILAVQKVKEMIADAEKIQPDTVLQKNIKPIERSEVNEQALSSYDLLPMNADSALTETPKNPDPVKTLSQKQTKQNIDQSSKPTNQKKKGQPKAKAVMQKRGF